MTLEELQKYPNVLDALRVYYSNKLEESIDNTSDATEEFKQMVREHGATHIDSTIVAVSESNPASLFYFFDEHDIIIEMTFMPELPMTGQFVPIINGEMGGTTSSRRKDSEKFAVDIAIDLLEEQLTKSVSDKENG